MSLTEHNHEASAKHLIQQHCLQQQPHQQQFQRVAVVAGGLQRIVQPAHALGGLHVDGVFFLVAAGLVAADEAEAPDLLVQLGQRDRLAPVRVEARGRGEGLRALGSRWSTQVCAERMGSPHLTKVRPM